MYFLTAISCTLIAGTLWVFFKDRKKLHLEVLTIVYGAATLMWFIDCCFSAAKGEGFLSFDEIVNDSWIALWTLGGGLLLWLLISFVLNNRERTVKA